MTRSSPDISAVLARIETALTTNDLAYKDMILSQAHALLTPAQALPSQELLEEVLTTLRHAHIFITSRERMHIDGVALYDDTIEHVKAALTSTDGGKAKP